MDIIKVERINRKSGLIIAIFEEEKNLILDLMHEMLILVKVIKVIQIQQTIFENSKKMKNPVNNI